MYYSLEASLVSTITYTYKVLIRCYYSFIPFIKCQPPHDTATPPTVVHQPYHPHKCITHPTHAIKSMSLMLTYPLCKWATSSTHNSIKTLSFSNPRKEMKYFSGKFFVAPTVSFCWKSISYLWIIIMHLLNEMRGIYRKVSYCLLMMLL